MKPRLCCTNCGRFVNNPVYVAGMPYGCTCARRMFGTDVVARCKPKRERAPELFSRATPKRDDRTADLFPAESRIAEWFASAPSLEML